MNTYSSYSSSMGSGRISSAVSTTRSSVVSNTDRFRPRRRTGAPPAIRLLLDSWDKGNRMSREELLWKFVEEHHSKTGIELESALGHGASLLLTRITTNLRLSLANPKCNIALHLRAISLFISSSTTRQYLKEFVESGGLIMLLEVVAMDRAVDEDLREALTLLWRTASSGRQYKELICENSGMRIIGDRIEKTDDEETLDCGRMALQALGSVNREYAGLFHEILLWLLRSKKFGSRLAGSMIVRNVHSTLCTGASGDEDYIDAAMQNLSSSHLQMQCEASELLTVLLSHDSLRPQIISSIVMCLAPPPDESIGRETSDGEGSESDDEHGVVKYLHRTTSKRIAPQYRKQVAAIKLVRDLFTEHADIYGQPLLTANVLPALLYSMGTMIHPDCQKLAISTLSLLAKLYESVADSLRSHLGDAFFDSMMNNVDVDNLHERITSDQAAFLRQSVQFVEEGEGEGEIEGNSDQI